MYRVLLISTVLVLAAACASVRNTEPSPATVAISAGDSTESQTGLVAEGRNQFLRCKSCHAVDAAAPPPFGGALGPHLEGIVGRPAASAEGFEYTDGLKALDLVWDEETLDRWLEDPEAIMPTVCEPFMGLKKPDHRKALIAYLKSPTD